MIRSVEIKNFRGIREGKLDDFTPLVILVGPNGSGKSTILDALYIGAHRVPGYAVGQVIKRQRDFVGAHWLCRDADIHTIPEITLSTHAGARECTQLVPDPSSPNRRITCKVSEGNEHGPGSVLVEFKPSGNFVYETWSRALVDVPDIRLCETGPSRIETPLHKLYTQTVAQKRREEVEGIIGELLPGATHVELLAPEDTPIVSVRMGESTIPAALVGDGIQTMLRLALELASCPHGVVLLEEPEAHKHPGAILRAARVIWAAVRRDIQIILCTHSLELIDALLAETKSDQEIERLSLYGLRLDEGSLKSYRHPGPDVAFARTTIENDLR